MGNPPSADKNYRFTLALKDKKKDWLSLHGGTLSFAQTNFRIAEQTLNFNFKNAWKMLANLPAEAQMAEAANPKNFDFEKLRYLLDEIRTFFAENPDSDF